MTTEEQTILHLVAVMDKDLVLSSEWWKKLKDAVNELILHDFSRLVQLLYLADVPEEKLKMLLKEKPGQDAAEIIAGLILQRQLQKIEARKYFSQGFHPDSSEERW